MSSKKCKIIGINSLTRMKGYVNSDSKIDDIWVTMFKSEENLENDATPPKIFSSISEAKEWLPFVRKETKNSFYPSTEFIWTIQRI